VFGYWEKPYQGTGPESSEQGLSCMQGSHLEHAGGGCQLAVNASLVCVPKSSRIRPGERRAGRRRCRAAAAASWITASWMRTASSTVQGRAVAFRQGGNVGQRGGVRASDVRPRGATLGRSAAAGTATAVGFVGLGGLGKSE
jgi:hypothetical protein